jgi:hypothetical protein
MAWITWNVCSVESVIPNTLVSQYDVEMHGILPKLGNAPVDVENVR